MTAEATKRSRANKRLGWASEKRAAAIYGTTRFPANTGGALDLVEFDGVYVQVKAGGTVTLGTVFDGLAAAQRAAAPAKGLAACHVEYHRGNRVRHLICFDAKEWADWNGYGVATKEGGTE